MNVGVMESGYISGELGHHSSKGVTVRPYNWGRHRHGSEIKQKLSKALMPFTSSQCVCQFPNPKTTFRIDYCDLNFKLLEESVLLIFYFNPVKGAAGQAIQRMSMLATMNGPLQPRLIPSVGWCDHENGGQSRWKPS
ncbi:MAG: hypothetical protein KIH01_01450 [Candidatus Freyarchaeota archaeon]|nr:hypothetical protein [Candidatus Jordarchaeia archaeon]